MCITCTFHFFICKHIECTDVSFARARRFAFVVVFCWGRDRACGYGARCRHPCFLVLHGTLPRVKGNAIRRRQYSFIGCSYNVILNVSIKSYYSTGAMCYLHLSLFTHRLTGWSRHAQNIFFFVLAKRVRLHRVPASRHGYSCCYCCCELRDTETEQEREGAKHKHGEQRDRERERNKEKYIGKEIEREREIRRYISRQEGVRELYFFSHALSHQKQTVHKPKSTAAQANTRKHQGSIRSNISPRCVSPTQNIYFE